MIDLRVVQAKAVLPINTVVPIRGFTPPCVLVLGTELNKAVEVLYNQVSVNEFMISSANRLIVRIPTSQVGQPLTSLQVLSTVSLTQRDAMVSLGLSRPLTTIQGLDRLVQEWVLSFLTTPGSDIFNPSSGGGGLALVGKQVSASGPEATAALSLAISRTTQQLQASQAGALRVPPSERLLSATLVSVKFDSAATTLSAIVEITNALGNSAQATVG